jgi:pimeloyl-ACP methyl ester carboxylesterase
VNITRITRPRALRLVIAAVIMAIVGLLIPLSQVASARTAKAAAANDGPKPRIVLVHGAWADTSSWDGVIKRLQADGYTVYAPPDPLQGLPYDTAYLADFLHTIPGPIVLVGHSYGGAVITNAATGNPQVKALVYVDAFLPAQGVAHTPATEGAFFELTGLAGGPQYGYGILGEVAELSQGRVRVRVAALRRMHEDSH